MNMQRLRNVLAVVALAVVALAAVRYLASVVSEPVSYWIVSDSVLGVEVVGGVGDSCGIARTVETPAQVQIVAECREPLVMLGRPALGVPHDFEVTLQDALGDRSVVDASGRPATLCQPRCGRPASSDIR